MAVFHPCGLSGTNEKLPVRRQSHLKGIRVSFLQHEAGATILKGESTSVRNGCANFLWAGVPSQLKRHIPPVPKPGRVAGISKRVKLHPAKLLARTLIVALDKTTSVAPLGQ
jgi:hypothetical protein